MREQCSNFSSGPGNEAKTSPKFSLCIYILEVVWSGNEAKDQPLPGLIPRPNNICKRNNQEIYEHNEWLREHNSKKIRELWNRTMAQVVQVLLLGPLAG